VIAEKPAPIGLKHPDGHWECRRCGYTWLPRSEARDPKKCPRCYRWLADPAARGAP
jgi:rubrerythrin